MSEVVYVRHTIDAAPILERTTRLNFTSVIEYHKSVRCPFDLIPQHGML